MILRPACEVSLRAWWNRPEKPMPRIIMPDVGVRCRTINYDEVLDVQEALDQRRNLSVREQWEHRLIRDHDPRVAAQDGRPGATPPPRPSKGGARKVAKPCEPRTPG